MDAGEYPLYAGAGQCDTTKGVQVGTVTVAIANGNANVTYNVYEGYKLTETHLYVGAAKYPVIKTGKTTSQTVALGQYTYKHESLDSTTDSYNVDVKGYFIAHAVVASPKFCPPPAP